MRRYVSISLPHWSSDRWRRHRDPGDRPVVMTAPASGGPVIVAVDARAAVEGLQPGQRLADACASVPYLLAVDADPAADARALKHLAEWCGRYTPWAAPDGADGIVLDITGCAHLFGGEAALLADLVRRLAQANIAARAAAADNPAAAWAWARFGETPVLAPGETRARLASLPVAALRISPEAVEFLHRLGLRRIADVMRLPRGPLAARLGPDVLTRLDRVLGAEDQAISPQRPPALLRARMTFAEAISLRDDLDRATRRLLDQLCRSLEADGLGARRLELALYRVDGTVQVIEIGTSAANRDAAHLARLFAEKLGNVAPGFGIETMILGAAATAPLAPRQDVFLAENAARPGLAEVVDRLQNRLGRNAVVRLAPVESHSPERAVMIVPALDDAAAKAWPDRPRPIQLLAAPEPIEMTDASFRWRRLEHRIAQMEGPERIEPEWWRGQGLGARDYYWLQDEDGRRYWVFRSTEACAWYLHGLFA
jgi:protein ImuB